MRILALLTRTPTNVLLAGALGLLLLGCARAPESSPAASGPAAEAPSEQEPASPALASGAPPQQAEVEKLSVAHLPNAYRIHPKVISGGLPEGDEAFEELKSLGVKTVISVDGAKPDVELARKYGMRYVHLPHSYDGVPDSRAKELAKAVRDLDGPVYIHCHHGKHRSPAASVVACVSAGLILPDGAKAILQTAGTSPNYRGLYQSAESARAFEAKVLDELKADFREIAPIPPMAEAMIDIEHTHDHLKAFAANDWQKLSKHPDLDPAHEALLLREHYTELMRTEAAQAEPEGFQKLLADGESSAQALEDAVRAWQANPSEESAATAKSRLEAVSSNCKSCHQTYRDVPLGEKAKP